MNYKVLMADEAIEDIFRSVKYIHLELCNPDAAEKLYRNINHEIRKLENFPAKFSDTGIRYRGYVIHKKIYETFLIFYTIDDARQEVYVLRVIKDLMNWKKMLRSAKAFHFSDH